MAKSNDEQTNEDPIAESTESGFSSGKIKRLVAVVLFLGAGSFAISQVVTSGSEKSDDPADQIALDESSPAAVEPAKKLTQNEVVAQSEKGLTDAGKGQPKQRTQAEQVGRLAANQRQQANNSSFQQPAKPGKTTPNKPSAKSDLRQKQANAENKPGTGGDKPALPQLIRPGSTDLPVKTAGQTASTATQGNGFALPARKNQNNQRPNLSATKNSTDSSFAGTTTKPKLAPSTGPAASGEPEKNNSFQATGNRFAAPDNASQGRGLRPAVPGEAPATTSSLADSLEPSAPLAQPNLLSQPGSPSNAGGVIPSVPRNPAPQTAFDKSRVRPPRAGLAKPETTEDLLPGFVNPQETGPADANPATRLSLPATPSATVKPTPAKPGALAESKRSAPTTLPSMRSPTQANMQKASSKIGGPNRLINNFFTKPIPDQQYEGVQAPSVTIEKIAPREIQVNTPADFQLIVKNVGRITANQVEVHDQIPQGTELMQAMPQPERGSQGQVSWKLGSLRPGQEKRIDVRLKPTTPGVIGSVAHVTFAAQASMRTRVTRPILTIRHRTQPKVMIGDTITLDIAVKNEGDGPATNVYVQEDVPQQLTFEDGIRELEYPLGTLAPGQSKNVKLTLKASSAGKLNNTIVAFADGGLQSQHEVELEVVAPNLVATSDGPRKRYLRRQATHQLAVQNAGTARATNVEMVVRLPQGLRFVNTNNRGKYDRNTHAVHWSMAELAPGQVATVDLTTVPMEVGDQNIRFEALADLQQNTNVEHMMNVEHLTDIFFDLDDVVDPIEVGSQTTYSLRIVNQGTQTANHVQVFVDMPEGIQPTAVEGDITSEIREQEILFAPITSLNPGDEITLKIHANGTRPGDHRIAVNLQSDGREINVTKQESTRVYSDR
ncbi:MAG: hypothetical protein MK108_04070 [Mariniblastus sp.]|nr:hypothetical protein [Mariniblastus sp.]